MSDTAHGTQRPLPPRYPAEIKQIERLTPRVVRLLLGSPELAAFQPAAPGSHIKLILPPPGSTDVAQPIRYDGIRPIFADGVAPPFLRTYTPLRFNPARQELEVEMLDHGNSPASNWTRRAQPGQRILVAGPRGGWHLPQDGDHYLIIADDTAIPAAVQVLQAIPANRPTIAIFEVADPAERRPLPGIPDTLPQWLYRATPPQPPSQTRETTPQPPYQTGSTSPEPPDQTDRATPRVAPSPNSPTPPGQPLENAIRNLQLPPNRLYIWMALESTAMRRIRQYLINDARIPPQQMLTRGYWKQGAPNHPDGDYGDP